MNRRNWLCTSHLTAATKTSPCPKGRICPCSAKSRRRATRAYFQRVLARGDSILNVNPGYLWRINITGSSVSRGGRKICAWRVNPAYLGQLRTPRQPACCAGQRAQRLCSSWRARTMGRSPESSVSDQGTCLLRGGIARFRNSWQAHYLDQLPAPATVGRTANSSRPAHACAGSR